MPKQMNKGEGDELQFHADIQWPYTDGVLTTVKAFYLFVSVIL
jgi:hypothetical protein